MLLSVEDIHAIADYLKCDMNDFSKIPIEKAPDHPGQYRLVLDRPCFFQDKLTKLCTVQDAKPKACRDYPFVLYQKGGCNLHDVVLCPEAHKTMDELFEVCGP